MNMYNKKSFTRYVNRLKSHPYKSELEYCERQADYIKYLYVDTSGSHNLKMAQRVWQHAYDALSKEVVEFKRIESDVRKKIDSEKNNNSNERREELKKLLG